MALRRELGLSAAEVQRRIRQREPLFRGEIFDKGFEEKARLLRSVIRILEDAGIEPQIYELEAAEPPIEAHRISARVLENVIQSAEGAAGTLDGD